MYLIAFATDYDGTLAHHGTVDEATIGALERLRDSGRRRDGVRAPHWLQPDRPKQSHKRHTRKYAEGELGEENSFYFRGPDDALNLRAQNLILFLQLADGVDDATWLFHLHQGDYTRWFREAIKDDELADDAGALQDGQDATQTRARMREIVERRYTAPAKG